MFSKVVHIAGSLACAGITALIGGFLTTGLISLLVDGICSWLGIPMNFMETWAGSIVFALSLFVWGGIGYLLGNVLQSAVDSFFNRQAE